MIEHYKHGKLWYDTYAEVPYAFSCLHHTEGENRGEASPEHARQPKQKKGIWRQACQGSLYRKREGIVGVE